MLHIISLSSVYANGDFEDDLMKCLTKVWKTCRNHQHPKQTTDGQKTGTSTENMDKRKMSELEDALLLLSLRM